jgi:hypothetical protein
MSKSSPSTSNSAEPRKKSYTYPTLVKLDAQAAKAKLQALGNRRDPAVKKMLSKIEDELAKKARPEL